MQVKLVIPLNIDTNCEYCNDCNFLIIFHTGMINEFHPKCTLFDVCGDWGQRNMKRCKTCLSAQTKYEKLKRKTK